MPNSPAIFVETQARTTAFWAIPEVHSDWFDGIGALGQSRAELALMALRNMSNEAVATSSLTVDWPLADGDTLAEFATFAGFCVHSTQSEVMLDPDLTRALVNSVNPVVLERYRDAVRNKTLRSMEITWRESGSCVQPLGLGVGMAIAACHSIGPSVAERVKLKLPKFPLLAFDVKRPLLCSELNQWLEEMYREWLCR